ncbi:MAG: VOC family protein [Candidatus Taylorbacteria bacterium]
MNKMNPVVHFEMPYEDKNRMADFYTKTFGWKAQMLGEDMGNYVVMQTGETDEKGMLKQPGMVNGGFYKKPVDKAVESPSFVISVEDVKESLKKIVEAGGKALGEPMDIPGIGCYCSFLDTEGNRASILQPLKKM